MSTAQFKLKKVAFSNKLLPGAPTQYKVAMVTPIVVSREKFIKNVMAHTGLSMTVVLAVVDSMEDCACDYMEIGNAVQLGENFGTLKPFIRVRAVNEMSECSAETVLGVGMRFIPTGRMRTRLADVGFSVSGESDGSDVDDSEVTPSNPSGSDDSGSGDSGSGSGSGESGNGSGGSGSGGDGDMG